MEMREKQENTAAANGINAGKTFMTGSDGKTWIDRRRLLKQDRSYWYVRRAQDIFFSLLALIVLAVPMLIVALVIWIDSPGASPFFTQKRVGRNGEIFDFLNLRWMKSWCNIYKEIGRFSDLICLM